MCLDGVETLDGRLLASQIPFAAPYDSILRVNELSRVHLADLLSDIPPLEPALPQPEPTIDEPSTTITPQDMTYCTAPDTTETEADVTIQAPISARGRGIPRGRGTSARGRAGVGARTAAPGGKRAPANAVEKRKREVCTASEEYDVG